MGNDFFQSMIHPMRRFQPHLFYLLAHQDCLAVLQRTVVRDMIQA